MDFPPVEAHMAFQELALTKIDEFVQRSFSSLNGHPHLYHYTGHKVVVDSLKRDGRFWATSASHMSDSNELRYGAEMVTEVLDAFLEHNPMLPFAIREFVDTAKERANPYSNDFTDQIETFFVCFSESGDLEHQWKHYANDAKGYCIHLDVMPPFADPGSGQSIELLRQNVQFLKVVYDRQEQYQLITEALRDFVNLLQDSTDKYGLGAMMFGMNASVGLYDVLRYYVMSFKDASKYANEKEWRCVYGMSNFANRNYPVRERQLRERNVPYVEMPLISAAGPLTIRQVKAGVNCVNP